ncbi:Rho guanine nucleotide exchange factor [Marasmius sp. AFHP31]|nr:Rho guanine nucleotide exchange factor [Marasmius sp. AFHP31]
MFGYPRSFGISDRANISGGSGAENDGPGSTTANNFWRWDRRSPSSGSPLHAFSGVNNSDSGLEIQKVTRGEVGDSTMNDKDGSRRNPPLTTHNLQRDLEDGEKREITDSPRPRASIVNPRPSSGRQLTPEKLRREENSFRQLLSNSEQYDDLLTIDGEDAQEVLNDWQRLSECTDDTELRTQIVQTNSKLSDNSGLFPECLWIGELKNLSKRPAEVGVFADIWTGNMSGVKVAVKVVRHRIDAQKREQVVKAFTRQAMVWRNLSHPNILPFTGIYWFNGDKEQISLVTPWMENGNLLHFLSRHPELEPETQLTLARDSFTPRFSGI